MTEAQARAAALEFLHRARPSLERDLADLRYEPEPARRFGGAYRAPTKGPAWVAPLRIASIKAGGSEVIFVPDDGSQPFVANIDS